MLLNDVFHIELCTKDSFDDPSQLYWSDAIIIYNLK